jgi:serine/threonine-protein kinase
MCTGQLPFGADSPLAVMRRVCDERPRPIRSLAPGVPPWLAAIVETLLAKDPAARFGSAADLADLLAGCLAHVRQKGAVPLPPAVHRLVRVRHRRRAGAAAAGLVLMLGLAGAGLFPWATERPLETAPEVSPARAVQRQAPAPGPTVSVEMVDRQMGEVSRRLGVLEADLQQLAGEQADLPLTEVSRRLGALEAELNQTVDNPVEPVRTEVQDLRRRLEALEQELTGKRP